MFGSSASSAAFEAELRGVRSQAELGNEPLRHAERNPPLMPVIPVSEIDDPRLAPYRQLNERNLTRHSGLFVAEGEKVVERLIGSRYEVASILAESEFAERYARRLPPATPIYVASRPLLEATIGFNFHRGVVACGRRTPPAALADLMPTLTQARVTLVVCPDVQDPTNLGSIIRTAAAFGCGAVVLGERCADPFSRRVLRVSMGAALHLPIVESRSLVADLQTLAAGGIELVATVVGDPSAEPLAEAEPAARTAILLGSEGHGLSAECVAHCHRRVTIPMQAGVDSLNVSVAAAVVLYRFVTG
jgi:tRNA G18 (ribose-2'-O)-methylase SpoU